MARYLLSRAAVKQIKTAVGRLFSRARVRFLGRDRGPKVIAFGSTLNYRDELTLPAVFDASSRAQGFSPNERLRAGLVDIAAGYLDAHERLAQTRVVHAVQTFLHEAEAKGVDTDVEKVLGGELSQVMQKVTYDVAKVFAAEGTKVRNAGGLDAVTKVAAISGVADPVVFFVVVRDGHRCEECTRLHLLDDGVTPRVWKLSEVGHGYHKRGEDSPKVGGLHPHCRCSMTSLVKGYGFNGAGGVTYVSPDHDEFSKQRGGE